MKDPVTDKTQLVGVLKTVAYSFNEMKKLALQVCDGQAPEAKVALEAASESVR
jgi:hypothetical protein